MPMKTISLCILLAVSTPLAAQVSIGVGLPGVSIGINLGGYPELEPIPGYPVYYAPMTDANLFFYDGLYWAYSQDGWYSSAWYNGPWQQLDIDSVPLFLLRVPVRYYRQPPMYFRAWRDGSPPRWGERWGDSWQQRHRDWDHWDRHEAPRLAPRPLYQRDYGGERYPRGEAQRELRARHYDYEPRDEVACKVYQRPASAPSRAKGNETRGNERAATATKGERMAPRSDAAPHATQRGVQRNVEHEPVAVTAKPVREARPAQPRAAPTARESRRESSPQAPQPRAQQRATDVAPGRPPPESARRPSVPQATRPQAPDRDRTPVQQQQQRKEQPRKQPQREQSQAPAATQAPAAAPNNKQRGRDNKDDKDRGQDNRGQR